MCYEVPLKGETMKDKAKELLARTKDRLASIIFKITHRTAPEHFTRKSALNFKNTALLILNLVKKSIKAELMNYFYQVDKEAEIPTRQAFSQAREKISYRAFQDFFELSCQLAVDDDSALFKGYRLWAFDGTSFAVGGLEKLKGYFGESTTLPGKAMCRISGVVDVLEDCIVNASVAPFRTGERALAIAQIKELSAVCRVIYLLDRGYWSPKLVDAVTESGQKFLMRIAKENLEAAIKKGLRVHTFTLPGGNEEILVTNLSSDEILDDELAWLYAKRWGIETKYLELKARLQIDQFSGESINTVLQDIYSTLYISNLVAFTCSEADKMIRQKTQTKENKYPQKANRSTCIGAYRKRFIDLCCLDDPSSQSAALDKLYKDISRDVSYPGKSKPRPRNKRQIKEARSHYSKPVF